MPFFVSAYSALKRGLIIRQKLESVDLLDLEEEMLAENFACYIKYLKSWTTCNCQTIPIS